MPRVLTSVIHTLPLNLADDATHSHFTRVHHLCCHLVTGSGGSSTRSHPHLAVATRAQLTARCPVLRVLVLAPRPPTLPRCQTQQQHPLSSLIQELAERHCIESTEHEFMRSHVSNAKVFVSKTGHRMQQGWI
ncbi:hypothetical protein E2C01_013571 [Portunus trituberculatus]|uniref:Uncharacterized protein n=1 Tax=Portunus trituberculatus TaxID=210409 RepID=A0A5B7DHG9_PORTR|nr:hypothetical protein [Portunus trituberculatus]